MIHFGYGINTYFKMLRRLMVFFIAISFVHVPLFVYYSSWNGLTRKANESVYTLGNLGQA